MTVLNISAVGSEASIGGHPLRVCRFCDGSRIRLHHGLWFLLPRHVLHIRWNRRWAWEMTRLIDSCFAFITLPFVFDLVSGVQLHPEWQTEESGVERHYVDVFVHRSGGSRVPVLSGMVRSDSLPAYRGKNTATNAQKSYAGCILMFILFKQTSFWELVTPRSWTCSYQ